jgi:hypothetical protein
MMVIAGISEAALTVAPHVSAAVFHAVELTEAGISHVNALCLNIAWIVNKPLP